MQRYPKSNEAMQARDRLRKLGVATTGKPRRGGRSRILAANARLRCLMMAMMTAVTCRW